MILSLKIGGCPIAVKDTTTPRSWSCHVRELHIIGGSCGRGEMPVLVLLMMPRTSKYIYSSRRRWCNIVIYSHIILLDFWNKPLPFQQALSVPLPLYKTTVMGPHLRYFPLACGTVLGSSTLGSRFRALGLSPSFAVAGKGRSTCPDLDSK